MEAKWAIIGTAVGASIAAGIGSPAAVDWLHEEGPAAFQGLVFLVSLVLLGTGYASRELSRRRMGLTK